LWKGNRGDGDGLKAGTHCTFSNDSIFGHQPTMKSLNFKSWKARFLRLEKIRPKINGPSKPYEKVNKLFNLHHQKWYNDG
jgi:hypothetical protein